MKDRTFNAGLQQEGDRYCCVTVVSDGPARALIHPVLARFAVAYGDDVPGPIGGAGDDHGLEDHGTSRLRLPAFKVVPSGL